MDRPAHDPGNPDCQCFGCHARGVSIGKPSDFSTRTWRNMKRRPEDNQNSWERGIPTDDRGMPWLDETGAPMGAKKVAEKRHSIAETARRRKASQPL